MTWEIIKDVLIPILTVAVSGLSAYIGAKRGRTAVFREKIFAKQIDAVSELFVALNNVFYATSADIGTSWESLQSIRHKWSVFLPQNVEEKFIEFGEAAVGKLKLLLQNRDAGIEEHQKVYNKLFDAFIEVESALRELIGVEPLTRETIEMYRLEPREKFAKAQKQLE